MKNDMSVIAVKVQDPKQEMLIKKIVRNILPGVVKEDIMVFKETSPGEERVYSVYKVTVDGVEFVLKKTNKLEVENYKNYLIGRDFPVPLYYGQLDDKEVFWIVQEYIQGSDLKRFNEKAARSTAKGLGAFSNCFWLENPTGINEGSRMDKYYKRILKRKESLKGRPDALHAFDIFINRQRTCPRTLSHGDLLPFNGIQTEKGVVFIDWGFSGIMPYSLDPARLISHGSESNNIFYITNDLKEIFLKTYYENLAKTELSYDEYLWDVQLSCLNESIEFIEESLINPDLARENKFFEFYNSKMKKIARGILENKVVII